MRKALWTIPVIVLLAAAAAVLPSLLAARDSQSTQPAPRTIRVSVRAANDGRFVEDLGLGDFEILDGGRPQTADGLAVIDNGRVIRQEGATIPGSGGGRRIWVLLQMTDYDSKIEGALNYLFKEVLTEQDSLNLITPGKPYILSAEAFRKRPKDEIAKETTKLVRKDILSGNSDYRTIMADLKRIVRAIQGASQASPMDDIDAEADAGDSDFGIELTLPRYKAALVKLDSLRLVDPRRFMAMAEGLRQSTEPAVVFLIYQREFRPEINPTILSLLMSAYQDRDDILASLQELFTFYRREVSFELEPVRRAFADSGAVFNFIFMSKQAKQSFGITMTEQSEDLFKIFSGISSSTGGAVSTSGDPGTGFRKTAEETRRAYILRYLPSDSGAKGEFRELSVRIKGRDCKVTHQAGYISR